MRLGVLGGTFDPVHIGHLVAASEVRHALGLDRVVLMVANQPWQKAEKDGAHPVTAAADRLAVVQAAIDGVDGLEAGRLEIDRGGVTYTADTVEQLTEGDPGVELFLIIGTDVADDLDTWKRVDEIKARCTLAIVERPGAAAVDLPGWRVERVAIPALDVSSTDLRRRLAEGRPADFLIPAPALRQIAHLGLYADGR
ncbi:MAG: nicotinate-nucleotide adenylyltransferase [Actinomycetota bacterium]|jgi:nicotinate-nucleotide adenylyltransferase|nr:nicotinate-nucleotide adenylyltransferase [Actinomycetota bacterium]